MSLNDNEASAVLRILDMRPEKIRRNLLRNKKLSNSHKTQAFMGIDRFRMCIYCNCH